MRQLVEKLSLLLSLDGMKLLDEEWVQGGLPERLEMVIEAEIYRHDTVWSISASFT